MANEIIKGMGFHHMALYVSDFDKSLAFYQKLGMKVYTAWGEGANRIALLDTGDGTMLEVFAKPGQEFAAQGRWQHLALHVENVESALQTALSAGRPCRCPLRSWILTRSRARSPSRLHSYTAPTARSWNLSNSWSKNFNFNFYRRRL